MFGVKNKICEYLIKRKALNMRKNLFSILIIIFCVSSCGWINKKMEVGKYETYLDFVEKSDKLINSFENYYENTFIIDGEVTNDFNAEDIEKLKLLEVDVSNLNISIQEAEGNSETIPKFEKVDDKFKEYFETIKKLKGKISEIISYYRNEEYKKDNLKKAKKLYLEYVEIKEKNKNKILDFKKVFEDLVSKIIDEEIKNREKNGDIAGARLYEFINIANDFVEEIGRNYYSESKLRIEKGSLERLKELKNKFEKVGNELKKITKSEIEKSYYDVETYNQIQNNYQELLILGNVIYEKNSKKEDFYKEFEKFNEILDRTNKMYNLLVKNN